MLHHVVMFRFKTGITQDQIDAITSGLASLPAEIEVIKDYQFGPDAAVTEGSWDYGLSGTFANETAYSLYAAHPAHAEVIRTRITPIVDAIARVQFRS